MLALVVQATIVSIDLFILSTIVELLKVIIDKLFLKDFIECRPLSTQLSESLSIIDYNFCVGMQERTSSLTFTTFPTTE